MKRKKIKIQFVEFESKLPVVNISVGDRELYALVDSGSETTLIDSELKGKKGIHSKKLNQQLSFTGMNGTSESRAVTLLRGDFSFGDELVSICGVSADISNISTHFKESYNSKVVISAVLGCDFLSTYNVVLDFDKHIMTLNYDLPRQ